jgi:hypothetical protein
MQGNFGHDRRLNTADFAAIFPPWGNLTWNRSQMPAEPPTGGNLARMRPRMPG